MEKSQMKNMVVLRNLPSNLVEEAIVVFKTVKGAKEFQYIDKVENIKNDQNKKNTKDYMVKEAESVISNYIKTNEKKNKKNESSIINKKYKKLKWYSIGISIAFVIALFIWNNILIIEKSWLKKRDFLFNIWINNFFRT